MDAVDLKCCPVLRRVFIIYLYSTKDIHEHWTVGWGDEWDDMEEIKDDVGDIVACQMNWKNGFMVTF